MKITKQMLKELIKEELENLEEMGGPLPEDEEENEGHGGEDHDDEDEPDMSKEEIVDKMEMMLDMLRDMI